MKKICLVLLTFTTIYCNAQKDEPIRIKASKEKTEKTSDKPKNTERSAFRRGYIRLGISTLGSSLDNSLTPKANALAGNLGTSPGAVFEFGHVFYFRDRSANYTVNFGLDWTILSLTACQLNKWEAYGRASNATNVSSGDGEASFGIASKLGPVVSFNPTGKLVIDARFQVGYQERGNGLAYSDKVGTTNRGFSFGSTGSDASNKLTGGLCTSFGVSIRRKAIGLSLDYVGSKPNTDVIVKEANGGSTSSKQAITFNDLQLKLSFTL